MVGDFVATGVKKSWEWVKRNPGYALGAGGVLGVAVYVWWQSLAQPQDANSVSSSPDTSVTDPLGGLDVSGDLGSPSTDGGASSSTGGTSLPATGTTNSTTSVPPVSTGGTPTSSAGSDGAGGDGSSPHAIAYTVRSGDTLSKIAGMPQFHTTWQKIYQENEAVIDATARAHGHTTQLYNWIFPGEQLEIIPGG